MTDLEITTPGLVLRPWRLDDIDAVYQACQDPDIQHWTRVPKPYEREHARQYVTEIAPTAWADGTGAFFAVTDATTGELLGSCGFVSMDPARGSAEVGYWTAPWARGRGVAVGATRAICRWGFEELDVRRVIWQASVGNHASRLVALRAGFRIEGELRLADGNPLGGHAGWVGSLLPGDPLEVEVDALTARRAKVFGSAQPVLAAKDATLRRPEERDIDAIAAACADPDAVRWTSVPTPYGRADAEEFALRIAPLTWARGAGAVFGIADPAGVWVGNIDLRILPEDPLIGEVGFLVAPEARGSGYATAALRALCEWAFAELGLARVRWRAHVGNVASRRVAEKAGFTMEGTLRGDLAQRGERRDAWVAGLVPGDLL